MRNITKKMALVIAITGSVVVNNAEARDQIRAVGSSTVYPFVTVTAEKFGNKGFKTPIIESTGTGGGFKLFCSGTGDDTPSISNASRAIKSSEKELCAKNGVKDITEIKIGYDGIVLANSNKSKRYSLTKEQIFKALAKQVPLGGKLVDNFYETWNEIDPSLPKKKIEVYGPPPTSGTRDAFSELVMQKACVKGIAEYEKAFPDKKDRKKACSVLREDGKYIEAGENDNLIVQKLRSNPNALGIFGFSFLDQNSGSVQGSIIDDVEPTFENISDGSYSVSRPLFVYIKNGHVGKVAGIKEFVDELISERAIGQEGYLIEKGLIPLSGDELEQVQKAASL